MKKSYNIPLEIQQKYCSIIFDPLNWNKPTKYYQLSIEYILKFKPHKNLAILQKYQKGSQFSKSSLIWEIIVFQKVNIENLEIEEKESV